MNENKKWIEITGPPNWGHIGKILWAPSSRYKTIGKLQPGDTIYHYVTDDFGIPQYRKHFVGKSKVNKKPEKISREKLKLELERIIPKEELFEYMNKHAKKWFENYDEFYVVYLKDFIRFDPPISANQVKFRPWGSYFISAKEEIVERIEYVRNNEMNNEAKSMKVENDLESKIEKVLNAKGQVILYGPPGTGKTYLARNYIIEKTNEDDPGNRWEFITFHQSYGYEEFIEGFRPKTDDEGKIRYIVEDGIFKRLVLRALVEGLLQREKERQENETAPIESNTIGNNNCDRDCLSRLRSMLNKNEPLSSSEYEKYIELKRHLWNLVKELSNEDLERLTPKFYLIIDEINRGNISKIFGELITLLEKDKRLSGENQLIVTLPYSGEPFAIPPNLYIIGTMNTADRSIALLDVALRRRFAFIEVEPKPEKLNNKVIEGVRLDELLEAINKRIEVVKDRDHRIGHSYFLGANTREDLHRIWYYEVIPLLMEYFYNDWETIKWVLNETGKDSGNVFFEKLGITGPNGEETYQVKVLTGDAFINALRGVIGKTDDSSNNDGVTNQNENSTENDQPRTKGTDSNAKANSNHTL